MKNFKLYLLIIISILLIGCSGNRVQPIAVEPITIEKIVIKPCQVPDIDCDFTGEGFIPTTKLLDCIILQKRALELCGVKSDSK